MNWQEKYIDAICEIPFLTRVIPFSLIIIYNSDGKGPINYSFQTLLKYICVS